MMTSSPSLEDSSLMDEEEGRRRGTEEKESHNFALNKVHKSL